MAQSNAGAISASAALNARENLFRSSVDIAPLTEPVMVQTEAATPQDEGRGAWRAMLKAQVPGGDLDVQAVMAARLQIAALHHCLPLVLAVTHHPGSRAPLDERRTAIGYLTTTALQATAELMRRFKTPIVEGSPLQLSVFQLMTQLVADDWQRGHRESVSDYVELCSGAISQEDVETMGGLVARNRVIKSPEELRQTIAIALMRESAAVLRAAARLKAAPLDDVEQQWVFRLCDVASDFATQAMEATPYSEAVSPEVVLAAVTGRLSATSSLLEVALESECARGWPPNWGSVQSTFERSVHTLEALAQRQCSRLADRVSALARVSTSRSGMECRS